MKIVLQYNIIVSKFVRQSKRLEEIFRKVWVFGMFCKAILWPVIYLHPSADMIFSFLHIGRKIWDMHELYWCRAEGFSTSHPSVYFAFSIAPIQLSPLFFKTAI